MSSRPRALLSVLSASSLLAIPALSLALGPGVAAAATTTVPAAADSYVTSASPSSNNGTATSLWVDGSPVMRTYLRFPAQATTPIKAVLQVYATRSTRSFEVRGVADTSWKETGITYASAPAVGSRAVQSGTVTRNSWVSIDVTSLLPASGDISLALLPRSTTSQAVSSREAGTTRAPRLVIESGSPGTPTPSPTPTPSSDTTAPFVTVTSPTSGTTITTAGTVSVTAAASDDVGVSSVAFYQDGVYRGTEDGAPYVWPWSVTSAENGTHTWSAKAFDAAGNVGSSGTVTVSVGVSSTSTPPPTGTTPAISALRETAPVPHSGDAADDAAIWVHPTNPSLSTVIGTDKLGGLVVYDTTGKQLHYYADSTPNNVDLRHGFMLDNKPVTLVVTTDTRLKALRTYVVDPESRGLTSVDARSMTTGIGAAGLCLYRSPVSGTLYAFDSDSSGTTQQWELYDNGAGKVDARKVRTISLSSVVEGCAADDATGALYLAQEDVALWRYDAEPTGTTRTSIDQVGNGRLTADIEGVAIYQAAGGKGYIIASSQGNDSYAVYRREAPNAPVGTFTIGAGAVDAVTHTDGLDVTNLPLGPGLDTGAFIAQDDSNDMGNQNFKVVPWSSIASALGLITDTTHAAAGTTSGSTSTPTASPTSSATSSPVAATAYYVDAAMGSDSSAGTSPTAAWRTLAKVNAQSLPAGASVLLRRGSSWAEALRPKGTGTASAPITIGAYGEGSAPVVTGQSTCVAVSTSYVVIRDLAVRGCSWAGIEVSGSHVRLDSNEIGDTAAGIYLKRTAVSNTVVGNRLVDNNRMSVLTTTSSSDDAGAFGILVHGDDNDIAGNTISGSDAFSYDYGRDGAAVEIYGGVGNRIHHNVAVDNDAFAELGDPRSANNSFAYNLVRSSLETSTFLVTRGSSSSYGPVMGTSVHNNTVVMTGASSQGFVCHAGCTPSILSLKNNIIQAVAKVGYADAPFDEGYNVYSGGQRQFTVASTSVVADPRFVDPASANFHLLSGSPAVDRGIVLGYTTDLDGGVVPMDGDGDGLARPDAGALEYAG